MSGRERAERICQAAVAVFFNPTATLVGLAREEVGDAFERFFPERTSAAQRLLSAVVQDFQLPALDGARGEHLASVATDLFARHGLASAELAAIAKPDLTAWAVEAKDRVCRRGLITRLPGLADAPASWNGKPLAEVDQAMEARLRALVEAFYAKLIANLDNNLQVELFGRLTRIIQCAPMARFTSGGRIHPESCRWLW